MSTRTSNQDATKIRARRDSISPTRQAKTNNYRDRSRDRSLDRSSVISNGNHARVEEVIKPNTTKETTVDDTVLKDDDDRGRTTERKSSDHEVDEVQTEDQDEMLKLMGFGSFDSTKGKHVNGVGSGGAKKNKKAQFRQYMNREKGFNRNLSPDRRGKKK